jgi:hypothetical protein
MEVASGFLLMIIGAFVFDQGIKEDSDAMGGLKYRKLLVGGAAFFFGLIMMLR